MFVCEVDDEDVFVNVCDCMFDFECCIDDDECVCDVNVDGVFDCGVCEWCVCDDDVLMCCVNVVCDCVCWCDFCECDVGCELWGECVCE